MAGATGKAGLKGINGMTLSAVLLQEDIEKREYKIT